LADPQMANIATNLGYLATQAALAIAAAIAATD
jgi:hypothetical protein